ncbi:otoferlin-like [Hetaerina americana]|uniref:otoferlin-like n=1 Tax=Hetaerina americana TaxID=62018 RepID=UPI003A7F5A12
MVVELYLWAGFLWDTSGANLEGIPRGYEMDKKGAGGSINDSTTIPPKLLRYYEKRVQYQTLNPVWDQMLLLRNIILYGSPEDIKSSPPTVVIEAMDKDSFGKEEYMGRGISKPNVKLVDERLRENEENSRLEWIEMFNAGEYAGEVLSAFELVELKDEREDLSFPEDRTRKGEFYHIPACIRPPLAHYRLQVLFWGLRCYGKANLKLDSISLITVEIGGTIVKSSSKDKGDRNFTSSFSTAELELPVDLNFCPPITIQVWEKRSFGRLLLVGSHIVNSIKHVIKTEDIESVWPTPITKGIVPRQETVESNEERPNEDAEETMKPLLESHEPKIRNGSIVLSKSEIPRLEAGIGPLDDTSRMAFDQVTDSKTSPVSLAVPVTPLQTPTYKILARVYIVRGLSLPPKDRSGRSDPYVVVSVGRRTARGTDSRKHAKFGRRVSGDRSQYVHQDLNPIFGRCYEVEASLPRDDAITVSVWDWDLGGHDDLIGTTEIDIENRFFTKCRATCGISSSYETFGYNAWRDPENPTTILKNLCEHYQIPTPTYKKNEIKIGESCFYCDYASAPEKRTQQKETLALAVLKQWEKVSTQEGKSGLALVPEHIETRSLFHPKKGSIVQGKLEMWIDMFRMPNRIEDKESEEHLLGPPVDISPRKPRAYELRVVIWNTASIELHDTNVFNEKSSDIYVKGWLYGQDIDGQTTDVHYRSLTGEGNFNWRFIFPLLYLQPEKCLVSPQEDNPAGKAIKFVQLLINDGQESGKKIPCRLNFQVWDEDRFTADDFIGALSLDLTNCPVGAKTAKACDAMLLENKRQKVDMFKVGRLKGWWPVVKSEIIEDKNKKKVNNLILTGKIEAEIQMLTESEAQKRPVGRGREGPEALPEPK